jgi:regulator of protease activity HflC (stomatin/prohibitin superfamily)
MTRTNMRRGSTGQWGVPITIIIVGIVLILGLIVIGLAYTPVENRTVALVKRFGGLTGQVFEPGLHWRTPFIDQVEIIATAIRSYEASDDPAASNANYPDYPVTAQTIDGQQLSIKYTVIFRILPEKALSIVQNIGNMDDVAENVVKAHSRNLARLWAQNYTAENLYSGEGIFAYEGVVEQALRQEFDRYGVALDDFLVRKVDFDEDYIRAIEQQQIAEEAIETAQYQADAAEYEKQREIRLAEAEAQRIKLQAEAEAERQRLLADSEAYSIKARAEADAERQRLLADSEAYSIEARGEALEKFPGLVQWEFVRNLESVQWGILPSEGLTPLVPLPSFEGEEEEALPTPFGEGE